MAARRVLSCDKHPHLHVGRIVGVHALALSGPAFLLEGNAPRLMEKLEFLKTPFICLEEQGSIKALPEEKQRIELWESILRKASGNALTWEVVVQGLRDTDIPAHRQIATTISDNYYSLYIKYQSVS